jgi:hypothetical protein
VPSIFGRIWFTGAVFVRPDALPIEKSAAAATRTKALEAAAVVPYFLRILPLLSMCIHPSFFGVIRPL